MNTIIIAAGRGIRLSPLTDSVPKCMLKIATNTRILDCVLQAMHDAGVNDISLVGGYRMECIMNAYPNLRYHRNRNWETTNILESLMQAAPEMSEDILVSYSDIVYATETVQALLESPGEAVLVVDRDWRRNYRDRKLHPESEAEKVLLDGDLVTRIGKHIHHDDADAEFIGLALFRSEVVNQLVTRYHRLYDSCKARRFHAAESIRNAYLTDMLQELIGIGVAFSTCDVRGAWAEIDTMEDLERVRKHAVALHSPTARG